MRWTPHPVIVTIMDNKDYIRVLLYSHYTTISGWGVLLTLSSKPCASEAAEDLKKCMLVRKITVGGQTQGHAVELRQYVVSYLSFFVIVIVVILTAIILTFIMIVALILYYCY